MTTNPSTTDRAQEAASTAADQGRHVAGVAKEEARNVASTAADQARDLAGETRQQVTSQLGEQATTQRDRLVGTLRSLGDDLDQMAGRTEGPSLAADLAQEAAGRARALGSHLDGREPGELLEDVREFARRRPGTFLLGALAAGVVAGRLLRGTADGAAAAGLAGDADATGEIGTAGPTDPPPTIAPTTDTPTASAPTTGAPTTDPPMPPATPGQQTMDAP